MRLRKQDTISQSQTLQNDLSLIVPEGHMDPHHRGESSNRDCGNLVGRAAGLLLHHFVMHSDNNQALN